MKHITAIFAVLMTLAIGLACSGGDDTAKANELVGEANKFIVEAGSAVTKVTSKSSEFDSKVNSIKNNKDLEAARAFGKELTGLYTTMEENFKKAGDKFEEAGKLNVNEKFKEYLQSKATEMKKRAEYSTELKKIPKALDDSQNEKAYRESIATIVPNVQKMTKEAQDLAEKADKIVKDNPTIIKPADK